ncbi:Valine--tRNA ligase [Alphaproteobacteria bacterium SO-S41]|nr:Valine--tRNA ligase [Alphaproteobacteria bacterium SO-S41]
MSDKTLDKTFDPAAIEQRLYAAWEQSGAFKGGTRPEAEPFSIVIPPPNVTGSLHIGHALNSTLQDILCRFERMRGKDVLWVPGTDHAGIATQLVVERQLREQQTSRKAIGRDEFLKRVWAWKAESGGTITRQLRRLGASCDWSRERFTMDEGLSRAVTKVFVQLHKDGLIYKDNRLVNWDPAMQTAVSDLEVESIDMKGHLWHLKYPLADDAERFIIVATTRPETMLGDTGVAVHPDDERYKDLVGKMVRLPLTDRLIPIVADSYADPEKGSGAVKITPAHDFNDFEVGRRAGLAAINILNRDGTLNDAVHEAYRGLTTAGARKKIVADLEEQGLLDHIEDITHAVPHDEKTKTVVIEPYLTEQWYLNVQPLADEAMKAVRSGETQFVPEHWQKTYFQWMENIQPWCVSRQLWWGHQIPAWYGPAKVQENADGQPILTGNEKHQIFVEEDEVSALAAAERFYGKPVKIAGESATAGDWMRAADGARNAGGEEPIWLRRDADVLDTWFSSGLWPFSTLGWPEQTTDLARFYPTSVLVTMFDIIFFWVARMMMFGVKFDDQHRAPFAKVLIHARVVDEKGQKMSKTKGNVVDPLTLIDKYGADALRFGLAIAAAQGKDVRMGPSRVEEYRNFCTKLWNAARFCEMNGCDPVTGFDPSKAEFKINKWIIGETVKTERLVREALAAFRFNDAATALYQFVWNTYCDWYVELIKPALMGEDGAAKTETRATAAWVFDQILHLMHPFTPYITEELWVQIGERAGGRDGFLMLSTWPSYNEALIDPVATGDLNAVIEACAAVRSVRSLLNVSPAAADIKSSIAFTGAVKSSVFEEFQPAFERLSRTKYQADAIVAETTGSAVVSFGTIVLDLGGHIDKAKELARLKKDAAKQDGEIAKITAKLGNAEFVAKAPEEVIEEQKDRRAAAEATRDRLNEAIARLG